MKFDLLSIVNQFNHQTAPVRYGIFGTVLALIVLVDFFTILGIQRGALKNTTEQINKLTVDINRVSVDKQRISQMRSGVDNARSQLVQLNQRVRPLNEMPMILEDIYRIAADTGLKIDQLTPLRDKQEKLTDAPEGGHFYALPILMEAHGGYHVFGRFLNRLEEDNLLFTFTHLLIELDPKAGVGLTFKSTMKVILVEHHDQEAK